MVDSHSWSRWLDRPIGDLVHEHSQAAAIFERFGLDYCSCAHQALAEAAREQGVPPGDVLNALVSQADEATSEVLEVIQSAQLDRLTRYIVERHHRYLRDATPAVNRCLEMHLLHHQTPDPQLIQVHATFRQLGEELLPHIVKEESLLFPFIDAMAAAHRQGDRLPGGPFGTVLNPIRVMEADHQRADGLLDTLSVLTNGFTPPRDGCVTLTTCYGDIGRYAADLHRHFHLEDRVLFPGALDLERALVS